MADDNLQQLEELFDRKLNPIHKELAGINGRLDTVAEHLAKADDRFQTIEGRLDTLDEGLRTVLETQGEQGEQLTRIERNLTKHDDRLEILEAKTAHLPDPRLRP